VWPSGALVQARATRWASCDPFCDAMEITISG
jgi:hypothetical protein